MKIGDLVRETFTGRVGFIEKIDKDYYGAHQAFKMYKEVGRGKCIRSDLADGIGPTSDGIRDRILVCWTDGPPEYLDSSEIEVIVETQTR